MKNTYIRLFSMILVAVFISIVFKITENNSSKKGKSNKLQEQKSIKDKHKLNYYYPATVQEVAEERINYLRAGNSLNDLAPKYSSQTLSKNASTSWESVGPFGITQECLNSTPLGRTDVVYSGRVISFAQDWVNPDIMYLGAASGGLWKSTDRGNTWKVILDTLPCPTVSTIATNPGKGGDVWIGTGNKGNGYTVSIGKIYHSTDYGLTWDDVTPSLPLMTISKITVKPGPTTSSTDIVFASTSSGIFRKDGVASFVRVLTGQYSDVVYTGSVFSSNFKVVASGNSPGVIGSGIKFSSDKGLSGTWNDKVLPSKSAGTKRITLTASLLGLHSKVYAIIASPDNFKLEGIWRSDNEGDSWVKVVKPFTGGQMSYNNSILVDNSNANLVWTGSNERMLYKSADGGTTWTNSLNNPLGKIHEDEQFLWDDVNSNGTIYVLNDGGLMKSTDSGENFNFIGNSTLSISQIYNLTVNPNSGSLYEGSRYFVGTQDNGIQYGPDEFKQWRFITCCDGGDIAFKDGKQYSTIIGLSTSSPNRIQTPKVNCEDGWDGFATGLPAGTPWSSILIYNGTHFFINLGNAIFRADNGVLPWQQLYDFGAYVNKIAVTNDNFVIAGLDNNFPIRRLDQDGDITLAPLNSESFWENKKVTDIHVSSQGGGPIFVTLTGTTGKRIVRSDDSGVNYKDITGNLPELVNARSVVTDPGYQAVDRIYIGSDLGVFVTTDGGEHWFEYSDGLPSVCYVNDIEYDPYSNKIVAATYGRGIFIVDPVTNIISVSDNENVPAHFELSQNYPNPFNPSTTIRYSIPNESEVSLSVYDELGQKVSELYSGTQAAGNFEVKWNASNFTSGVYFLRMNAVSLQNSKHFSDVKKLILLK